MAWLVACAPALDWREVRPAHSGLTALFPCKPVGQARRVVLGTDTVQLELHACKAGAATWAVAIAQLDDPARVNPALLALREAAAMNLSASNVEPLELRIDGATPNPASQRVRCEGRMPDGRPVTAQVAVFAKGTRVFQATAVSATREPEAMETFFANLRFVP